VAGGLSQSAVNDKAGARTPLALVFASLTLALCLVFLTGLVRDLPKAVLAAIVLVAVKGLIDVRGIRRLRRVSRFELRVALVALVGVLLLGILKGVVLAAIVSILMLLRRAAAPHVAFLGRIPGTRSFGDLAGNPENMPVPGLVAFRVESSLLYFNAESVLRCVLDRVAAERPPVRLVVGDLSTSPYVDLAGAEMLEALHGELARRGIELRLVKASDSARDILGAAELLSRLGPVDHSFSLSEVVEDFERSPAPAAGPAAEVSV
jgi:MFS superfamily sulfate permease-like transporter